MPFDSNSFIQNFNLELSVKIVFLILIGLYTIFSFMLATKIRSLNKIVFLPPSGGAALLYTYGIVYTLAVLSLFLITLVIV